MKEERRQRAAKLVEPMKMEVVLTTTASPGPGEVRVRLEGCGVCASNLPVWEGRPWFQYPVAAGSPGHEGWGVVDAVGEGVEDLEPGERVALLSGNAYAEYDVAPREAVVRLPRELSGWPFPGEPLGCAMNILERSDLRPGHSVAIVGAGFLGVLLTQLAVKAGAHVVVISRRKFALVQAEKMGAVCALQSDDEAATRERALKLTEGRGYDRVIEAAGLQSTLDLASALAAEYGRLVIAGYHQDGLRQVNMQQWNWRALDVVNAHERSMARYVSGMQRAVDAVLHGRMDPFPLLTHQVTLDSLDEGFKLTRARPDGFMKAFVRIGGWT
ncbi:MAG TPA: zinc-binding dehydrogenase [Steroidobacter sp.]|jgi:threonine dehydrogenase-like Zn-dependent dehydrogenase|nr:zinc-binding dehydrogenase [Steroidobacter sp.]